VYQLTEEIALVQTVDFITPLADDPFIFGQVAAANALSDIYAMGGRPLTALNLCCFPGAGLPAETLQAILLGGLEKIHESGAALIGGHTVQDSELKYGLAVTGLVHPQRVLTNAGAKPGDWLILTKPIGSGVLYGAAHSKVLPNEVWERVLTDMVFLNKTACELMLEYPVHACTDITGFGLAGHAMEIARNSQVGLRIQVGRVPHYPEALEMIRAGRTTRTNPANAELVAGAIHLGERVRPEEEHLLYDPQTSGGLLISLPPHHAESLLEKMHLAGIKQAGMIGEVFESATPLLQIV
jgi:selenide,water dikinase